MSAVLVPYKYPDPGAVTTIEPTSPIMLEIIAASGITFCLNNASPILALVGNNSDDLP